jgi:translation elongation factor EF-1alpha
LEEKAMSKRSTERKIALLKHRIKIFEGYIEDLYCELDAVEIRLKELELKSDIKDEKQ